MKPFRNIAILLAIIILVPVLFFSFYELSRINRNEKELVTIYNKQLDAILFSINQYSDDIINSWASKIRLNLTPGEIPEEDFLSRFLNESPQIRSVASADMDASNVRVLASTNEQDEASFKTYISKVLVDSAAKIKRLSTYYRGGYRRTEAFASPSDNSVIYCFFLAGEQEALKIFVIEINAQRFIRELLGQKIQVTAENKMSIGVIDKLTSKVIYSIGNIRTASGFQAQKPLWLFPQFAIGIGLLGSDVSALSGARSRNALGIILFADLLFIVAALLVFRNIRKEVRLAQIKSEFISNVSHEIRTPLALISMYAETLEMDRIQNEAKKKEYYSVIFGEAQRLSGIVNRILNFSKMESGKRTYSFSTIDLNEMISRVMHSYSFHLRTKGFEYTINLCSDKTTIDADFEAVSDAFINILDNAIKYSPQERSVEVSTGVRDGYAFFQVRDKGIGIAREHHKLIFDKFYRVARGNLAYAAKGTGLGLTIVKNIVDAHHGFIEVDSTPGEGSIFRVLFPLQLLNHV